MKDKESGGRFRRLVFARTSRYLGANAILCAVTAALMRGRIYFVFSLCAAGGMMLLWGWISYLSASGRRSSLSAVGISRGNKRRTPFYLQRIKHARISAFSAMREGFDDDLSDAVSTDEGDLDEDAREKLLWISRMACGILLIALSLLIKY